MYNNKGKRDILIFPKFKNIDLIQQIRIKYDRLATLVEPHITLAFPFSDEISNNDLIIKLSELLKQYNAFEVTFNGTSMSNDNYILLNCIKGKETIIDLHNEIYNKIIPTHLKKDINYIPHITLGQSKDIEELKDFNYEFTTIIDEISVELIGEKEESIIIGKVKIEKELKI